MYERIPKVCNQAFSTPNKIDGSGDQWWCSFTTIKESGISRMRNPPIIWSCATAKQCNVTVTCGGDDDGCSDATYDSAGIFRDHSITDNGGRPVSGLDMQISCKAALE